ncbi:MAG: ABC transporter permease [Lactobacillaceae bacterium]|jgi:ABC-2 type transport system permease protein|nr:ABC transporter permease [Lactobacillaceae bacterium]
MQKLFSKRLYTTWVRYFKLSRFVFNDHAILALFILLGAGLMAYRNIWMTAPQVWWSQLIVMLLSLGTLYLFKKPASFVLPADPVFLLADEPSLNKLFKAATTYSMVFNGVLQALMALLFWPMYFRLFTTNLWLIILASLVLVAVKMWIVWRIAQSNTQWPNPGGANLKNWRQVEQLEAQRRGSVDGFFNMFIDIPGQRQRIKQHKWLEASLFKLKVLRTGDLLTTAFVRRPEFINTWLRLTVIGFALSFFVGGWLRLALLVLLMYLLILQLVPLANLYDRVVFKQLYPMTAATWRKKFVQAMRVWIGITTGLYMVGVLLTGTDPLMMRLISLIVLAIAGYLLLFLYADYMIKDTQKRGKNRALKK